MAEPEPRQDTTNESLPPFAVKWWMQRRLGYERLKRMRREETRRMTQAEAARVFAQLDPARPYVLRPSSGLVEQQRLFAKLHRRSVASDSGQ